MRDLNGRACSSPKGGQWTRTTVVSMPDWFANRVERGIQSAEAVITRAGDSSRDPRLLLTEFEFGRLLATMSPGPA